MHHLHVLELSITLISIAGSWKC